MDREQVNPVPRFFPYGEKRDAFRAAVTQMLDDRCATGILRKKCIMHLLCGDVERAIDVARKLGVRPEYMNSVYTLLRG